jgi:mono/diheme cytochrome c family protein
MAFGRVLALGLLLAVGATACGGKGEAGGLSDAAKHGKELARSSGCSACHGANGEGGLGPAWVGAVGSTVKLTDGTTVTVDEAYLTRSIKDPQAQVVDGYSVAMPQNELSDADVADLVAYITSLKPGG